MDKYISKDEHGQLYYIFPDDFNRNIDGVNFPDALHTLIFGRYFDQKIDNVRLSDELHTLI
jgi:hypothetical protein